MKKLFAAILISLTLFVSFGRAYDDIPQDSPYFFATEYLRQNDVFANNKKFYPDKVITKAEFVKYLVLLNSPKFAPKANVKLPFEDTDNKAWYAPYFYQAIQLGILSDRDRKVAPYDKLSLFEALELLFHSKSIPIPKTYVGEVPYKDVAANKRITPLIMRALEFDLIQPEKNDYVGVYHSVTRATAALMIYKMDLVNLEAPSKKLAKTDTSQLDPRLQKIISSWDLINHNYLRRDEVDPDKVADAAIKAMTDSLGDPYSTYMDKAQNATFSDELSGSLEGIGAYLEMSKANEITIVSPIANSPAANAGLKPGDIIVKIDGVITQGMNLPDAVSHIKGKKGTSVTLTIQRGGATMEMNIQRAAIDIKAIETKPLLGGAVLHVSLNEFSKSAADEFVTVVQTIRQNPSIKGMILDMRNNPGGLLDGAERILSHILPDKSIAVNIKYNYFNYAEYTVGDGELKDFPIVVLINKGSASAAEIVAGALQDYKAATLVGQTSFGKGTVQEVNYFNDSSSLKITVAQWMTPFKHDIQGIGVTPDVEVAPDETGATDPQLDRALEELQKKMR